MLRTRHICILLPKTVPLPQVQRHPTFSINDHRQWRLICQLSDELRLCIPHWIRRDLEQFRREGRGGERVVVTNPDEEVKFAGN